MTKRGAVTLAKDAVMIIQPTPGDGTSLEERLHALLDAEPSLASRHFAMQVIGGVVEDELDEAVLTALGVDYHAPDTWPCNDITYDYYDASFELKGTREDWTASPEGLAKAWTLGFSRCWICYGGAKYGPDADPNYHEDYFTP